MYLAERENSILFQIFERNLADGLKKQGNLRNLAHLPLFSGDIRRANSVECAKPNKKSGNAVGRGLYLNITAACSWFCLAVMVGVLPSAAQEAEGFTFKRVAPPTPGQTKRITIQVEKTWPYDYEAPKPEPQVEAESAPGAAPAAEKTDAWFWAALSPALDDADPIRLDRALTALNANGAQKALIAPSAATMDKIIKDHGQAILLATAGKRVSPAFALAVIAVESAGRVDAKSEKGAMGLMQLIPATAERFGVTDANDPKQNISGGVAYLDWLLGKFGGDPILSLAGYNAGENAVIQNNGVPPYAETRAYIPKVVAAWDRARLYCKTIPKYADDGCVFELNRSFSN